MFASLLFATGMATIASIAIQASLLSRFPKVVNRAVRSAYVRNT
jgi:hypothetical protein